MDDKKVCFIMCTNNTMLMNECIEYINRLYVPEGVTVDILTITDAKSMTSGYNEGMNSTDAKYKVYLHQDVYIINRYFLFDLLSIFDTDSSIGMIGVVGYRKMDNEAIMWHSERCGQAPLYGATGEYENADISSYRFDMNDGINEVEVADGLLLATAYDVVWDENYDAWDFYDATQCFRFRNSGYKVVVPNQVIPWTIHDDGVYLSVWNYNKYREKFVAEYMKGL